MSATSGALYLIFGLSEIMTHTRAPSLDRSRTPSICIIIRPAAVVMSIASVTDRSPAPTASSFSRITSRSLRERESLSNLYDQDVPLPDLGQRMELGPLPSAAACHLYEELLASRGLQNLSLRICVLVPCADPRISDEYSATRQPSFYRRAFPPRRVAKTLVYATHCDFWPPKTPLVADNGAETLISEPCMPRTWSVGYRFGSAIRTGPVLAVRSDFSVSAPGSSTSLARCCRRTTRR